MTITTETPVACPPSAVADMVLTWTTGNGEPLVFEGDLIVHDGEFFRVEDIQSSAIRTAGSGCVWTTVGAITAIGYEQVAVERRYTEG